MTKYIELSVTDFHNIEHILIDKKPPFTKTVNQKMNRILKNYTAQEDLPAYLQEGESVPSIFWRGVALLRGKQ